MCETIFPVVSVGDIERDSVGEVLPVTIRLDAETWDALTEEFRDHVPFGMPDDTLPWTLRERIRSFLETVLVNEMAARDYLIEEDNGPGA